MHAEIAAHLCVVIVNEIWEEKINSLRGVDQSLIMKSFSHQYLHN
jgi:hypothetical protein